MEIRDAKGAEVWCTKEASGFHGANNVCENTVMLPFADYAIPCGGSTFVLDFGRRSPE